MKKARPVDRDIRAEYKRADLGEGKRGVFHAAYKSARLGTRHAGRASRPRDPAMRTDYDFSDGRRGPVRPLPPGRTRITIRLNDEVLAWFKAEVNAAGGGNYQSRINAALLHHIARAKEPLEETLRRVLREEMGRRRKR